MMTTRIFSLFRTKEYIDSRMVFTIMYKPNGEIDSGQVVQYIRYARKDKWRKHPFYWGFDSENKQTFAVYEENKYDPEFLRRLWISMREAKYEVETEMEESADAH